MSRIESILLTIPEPCSESWQEMTPNGCGRFCNHCEKTVVDFSGMSDDEVLRIMLQSKDVSCGRFNKGQLNRPLIKTQTPIKFWPLPISKAAALFLMAQSLIINAFAQKRESASTERTATTNSASQNSLVLEGSIKDYLNEEAIAAMNAVTQEQNTVIHKEAAKAVNFKGAALVGMEISIAGWNVVKYSDKNGHFRFVLPASFRGKKLIITARYQPSSSTEIEGTKIRSEEVTFGPNDALLSVQLFRYVQTQIDKINIEEPILVSIRGDISSGAVVSNIYKKTTFFQKIKRLFKRKKAQ